MRKITAIALLITLVFVTIGYHFAFRIHLNQVKAEIKRNLRRSGNRRDVVTLTFTHPQAQQLEWEEDHEFRWKGEMYDVIEKRTEGNTVSITCVPDKKEKQLLEIYQNNVEKNQGWGKTSLAKLMSARYLKPAIVVLMAPQKILSRNYFISSSCLCFRPHSIFTPPPEAC